MEPPPQVVSTPQLQASRMGRDMGPGRPTVWLCERSRGPLTQGEAGTAVTTGAAGVDWGVQDTWHTCGPRV